MTTGLGRWLREVSSGVKTRGPGRAEFHPPVLTPGRVNSSEPRRAFERHGRVTAMILRRRVSGGTIRAAAAASVVVLALALTASASAAASFSANGSARQVYVTGL